MTTFRATTMRHGGEGTVTSNINQTLSPFRRYYDLTTEQAPEESRQKRVCEDENDCSSEEEETTHLPQHEQQEYQEQPPLTQEQPVIRAQTRRRSSSTKSLSSSTRTHNNQHVPAKVFARETESQQLFQCYQNCLKPNHKGITLITGVSGTGKTTLAFSLEPIVTNQNEGFFLYGKCDQLQHKITLPYAPFVQAFARLVEDLLQRTDEYALKTIQRLRHAVIAATKETGTALLDAIPALKKLYIPVSSAVSQSNHSQIITVPFRHFLREFCNPQKPLVLLLDDLQWLDSNSLALYQTLALSHIPGFFLLGTCRGNEVELQDQLAVALRSIEDQGIPIIDIRLGNLNPEALQLLIQHQLQITHDNAPAVAELVYQQSGGNPFHALQLIRNLQDTNNSINILHYNQSQDQWSWSDPKALDCNNLVAGILVSTFDSLPKGIMERVLHVASCLGANFTYTHLKAATQQDPETLTQVLDLLQDKGILQSTTTTAYRWVHDRFQQVAYELIPSDQRVEFRISLGLRLLQGLSPLELETNPFVVVHQFCRWTVLEELSTATTQEDQFRIAKLCLVAGRKATASAACDTAATYLQVGLDVLGAAFGTGSTKKPTKLQRINATLDTQYETAVALCNELAHANCCIGNFEAVEENVGYVVDHPKTTLQDKLRAHEIHISSMGARQDLGGAVRLGLRVLRELLGEVFPLHRGSPYVLAILLKMKFKLKRMKEKDILGLKQMTNWKKLAACRIINSIYPSCCRTKPMLAVLIAIRGLTLSLKYGLSTFMPLQMNVFAMVIANPIGDIGEAKRLADIGMKVAEREECNLLEYRCRLLGVYWGFINPFTCPLPTAMEQHKAGANYGMIGGDVEMACMHYFCYISVAFLASGQSLGDLESQFAELHQLFSARHQETYLFYLKITEQALQCLRDPTKANGCELTGDYVQEKYVLAQARGVGDELGVTAIFIFKCLLAVYFNRPEEAGKAARQLRKRDTAAFTVVLVYQAVFVCGLAEVMAARASKKRWASAGKTAIQKLKKYAVHAPENVTNKILLIQAHRATLRGQKEEAFEKFDLSMHYAKQNGFLNEEALACEHAGMAHIEWGEWPAAAILLRRAQSLYGEWGSAAKVKHISGVLREKNISE